MWLIETRGGHFWDGEEWADIDKAVFYRDKDVKLPACGMWVQPRDLFTFQIAQLVDGMQRLGWFDDGEDFTALAGVLKMQEGQLDNILTAVAKHMGTLTTGLENPVRLGHDTNPHWKQTPDELWRNFRKRAQKAIERGVPVPDPPLPMVGTKISVPMHKGTTIGVAPTSLCLHHQAKKLMATIIILGAEPWFMLSAWGNGPGYVCFLDDADIDDEVFTIKVTASRGKSVIAVPCENAKFGS